MISYQAPYDSFSQRPFTKKEMLRRSRQRGFRIPWRMPSGIHSKPGRIRRKKPKRRYVAPFRMVIPRQKPPWSTPVPPRLSGRTPGVGTKPKRFIKPTRKVPLRGTAPGKVRKQPKRSKLPKMITMNFPAPPRAQEGIIQRPSYPQKDRISPKQEPMEEEQQEVTPKKNQGATMLKIGVVTVVALAAVWIVTSKIAFSKLNKNGHTR